MSFWSTLKLGEYYLKTWPLEAKLGAIFPENRVIKTTMFAQKFMPFMAAFAVVWSYIYGRDFASIVIGILTAIAALCIPIQGLYWLGKRAQTPLPIQSKLFFEQTYQKLTQLSVPMLAIEQPTYQDLAQILQKAKQYLDADFWQDL